jgi:hypothetical protein
MPQPPNFSLAASTDPAVINRKANIRHQYIMAALAGAAGANNAGAALYTASQAATYAIACADAVVAALVAEG